MSFDNSIKDLKFYLSDSTQSLDLTGAPDLTDALSTTTGGSNTVNHGMCVSLDTPVIQELVKKVFLNNFDFSYLEEIFKECSSEELKLIYNNYEYIIKLVEKHYFNKV